MLSLFSDIRTMLATTPPSRFVTIQRLTLALLSGIIFGAVTGYCVGWGLGFLFDLVINTPNLFTTMLRLTLALAVGVIVAKIVHHTKPQCVFDENEQIVNVWVSPLTIGLVVAIVSWFLYAQVMSSSSGSVIMGTPVGAGFGPDPSGAVNQALDAAAGGGVAGFAADNLNFSS